MCITSPTPSSAPPLSSTPSAFIARPTHSPMLGRRPTSRALAFIQQSNCPLRRFTPSPPMTFRFRSSAAVGRVRSHAVRRRSTSRRLSRRRSSSEGERWMRGRRAVRGRRRRYWWSKAAMRVEGEGGWGGAQEEE